MRVSAVDDVGRMIGARGMGSGPPWPSLRFERGSSRTVEREKVVGRFKVRVGARVRMKIRFRVKGEVDWES